MLNKCYSRLLFNCLIFLKELMPVLHNYFIALQLLEHAERNFFKINNV